MRRISVALTLLAAAGVASLPVRAQLARDVVVAKVPSSVRQAEGFDPADSAGLFVGIRDFEDEKFLQVPYAVDDAVDLAHLFAIDLELIKPSKVVLALAGEPQKAVSKMRLETLLRKGATLESAAQTDVLRSLDRQRRVSGPKGLFVAAFATHGFSDQGSDFLVAADSLRSFIQSTGVVLNQAFDVVAKANAPRRLVLLDACRERFTSGQRGVGGSEMGQTFHDAIAGAKGQVVLSGTTLGGYSYDDRERLNGVFTAAVLDGLRGGATTDARSLITVRTLTDYVNDRVLAWVRDHRPEDAGLSQGISRRLEGAVADMPLAADMRRLRTAADYKTRRDAALGLLRQNLDPPLTGAIYDQVRAFLGSTSPSPERLELIAEIEALDGSARMRRALESYWRTRGTSLLPAADPATSTGSDRRTVESPLPAKAPPSPYEDPVLGIDFVVIEPGTFQMGSPVSESGRRENEMLHTVTLTRGFWMGATEVTQGQWQKLMGNNPSSRKSCGTECPVESVNWYEALAFANELSRRSDLEPCYELSGDNGNEVGEGREYQGVGFKGLSCKGYRLPTEAEWEMAARSGTGARYAGTDDPKEVCAFGNVADTMRKPQSTFECGDGHRDLAPVASFRPNDFQLYDMTGNAWEWVWDIFGNYEGNAHDPLGLPSGEKRVYRGGSFGEGQRKARVAYRSGVVQSFKGFTLGFRVARSLP